MLKHLVCASAVLLAASACRTPEEGSSDVKGEIPADAQGMPAQGPMRPLVSLEGEAAQGMYDAFNAEEQIDQLGARKSYQDRASIFCERSGIGGQIPPGAQGIIAPATFRCIIQPSGGANFPDGAQGMPPAPVLVLEGDPALAFYGAFQVREESSQGNGRKSFQGELEANCQYSDKDGARIGYTCQVHGASTDGSADVPVEPTLLTLNGDDAKKLHEKLKLPESAKTKQRNGDTVIHCEKHKLTFQCRIAEANGKLLAKLDGSVGAAVFNKLLVDAQDIEGGLLKEYSGPAKVQCSWAKVSGKKRYDCSIVR